MKAILVGSNGYLGSNIVHYLIKQGVSVLCMGRQPVSNNLSVRSGVRYIAIDVTNMENIPDDFWQADAVIYLAGSTGTHQSFGHAADYIRVNEEGMINVLNAIVRSGARPHFIFPSSRLVYKGTAGRLREEDAKDPKTIYAINKLAAEHYLKAFSNYYGLQYTVFRIGVPYGNLVAAPFSFGTVGFMLTQATSGTIPLFGKGEPRRTFTHVADIAALIYQSIGKKETIGGIFNIGGEDLSLNEVATLIAQKTGAQVAYHPWPARDQLIESGDTVFDSSAIDRLLQYTYQFTLHEWLLEHPVKK